MSLNLSFEDTSSMLVEDCVFPPSRDVVNNANITAYMKSKGFDNYEDFYRWSLEHRFEFWCDVNTAVQIVESGHRVYVQGACATPTPLIEALVARMDFMCGAALSKRGRPIIALPATARAAYELHLFA